ncbi:MAG: hypothetical protein WC659_01100 [Patescibacteria group bacterium]
MERREQEIPTDEQNKQEKLHPNRRGFLETFAKAAFFAGTPKVVKGAVEILQSQESKEAVEKRILERMKEWFEQVATLMEKYGDGWKGVNYEGFDFEYMRNPSNVGKEINYNLDTFRFKTDEDNVHYNVNFNQGGPQIFGLASALKQPDSSFTLKTYQELNQELGKMGYIPKKGESRYLKELSLADVEQFMNKLPNQEQIQAGLQEKEKAKKWKEEQKRLQKEKDKEYLRQLQPRIDSLVSSGKFKKLKFGHEAQVSYGNVSYRLFYRGDALFIEPAEKKQEEESLFRTGSSIADLSFERGEIKDYSNGLYKQIIEALGK